MLATGTRGEGSKSVSYLVPSFHPSMKDSNDKPNATDGFEISSAKLKRVTLEFSFMLCCFETVCHWSSGDRFCLTSQGLELQLYATMPDRSHNFKSGIPSLSSEL